MASLSFPRPCGRRATSCGLPVSPFKMPPCVANCGLLGSVAYADTLRPSVMRNSGKIDEARISVTHPSDRCSPAQLVRKRSQLQSPLRVKSGPSSKHQLRTASGHFRTYASQKLASALISKDNVAMAISSDCRFTLARSFKRARVALSAMASTVLSTAADCFESS